MGAIDVTGPEPAYDFWTEHRAVCNDNIRLRADIVRLEDDNVRLMGEVTSLMGENSSLVTEVNYWRNRCELATDARDDAKRAAANLRAQLDRAYAVQNESDIAAGLFGSAGENGNV